jgi:hypothetical protein
VQFLILAGHQLFPARHFETRAAKRLLKDKKLRVFSDALDRNWRVKMSRANVARDPNSATDRELIIGHHCTYVSSPFVSKVGKTGFFTPIGSITREYHPSNATGGGASGRVPAGTRCGNMYQHKAHPSAYGGRSAQPRTRRIGIELAGVFLRSEAARAAMDECELSGEPGSTVSVQVFLANRRVCCPEGRERGPKVCR